MRQFLKPAIGVPAQLALLKQRGLIIEDESKACGFLDAVSFFRLTPYMQPFQQPDDARHAFIAGTSLENLMRLYDFDRRLRLLVMDAMERIEVAARTSISNHMAPINGAHWYLKRHLFHASYRHSELLEKVRGKQDRALLDHRRECQRIESSCTSTAHKQKLISLRAKESYARHYALNYNMPRLMPAWAAMEELTFGDLSHLFQGLARDADKKAIAYLFGLPGPLLQSWLHTLTTIRNICAHHARLWNRELGIRPEFPKTSKVPWPKYLQRSGQHGRTSAVLCILSLLVRRISPNSKWERRLKELMIDFPEINLQAMGFPPGWEEDPFWKLPNPG